MAMRAMLRRCVLAGLVAVAAASLAWSQSPEKSGTDSNFSSPPCSTSRTSTAIGRARTTHPGMKGVRDTTNASIGSPSGESVCGTNP